jgi:hypothetical protein
MSVIEDAAAQTGREAARAVVRATLGAYATAPPADRLPQTTGPLAAKLLSGLDDAARREPSHFHSLIDFVQLVGNLAAASGRATPCTIGDALTALAPPDGPADPVWPSAPQVEEEVLRKLERRETSAGIAQNQRDNREGWWAHAERNRRFIREAVPSCGRRGTAVALGVGHAFDLPLVELAAAFDRLVLVDIDGATLNATVGRVFKDAALRARVEVRVADVTGINATLLREIDRVVADAASPADARAGLATLCRSYVLRGGPPLLLPGERADLMISSCLLSQIAFAQVTYARNVFERRFGALSGAELEAWRMPWRELELRVQQDHINALTAHADVAVLTSDLAVRETTLGPDGLARPSGPRRPLLGVNALQERIPHFIRVVRRDAWEWDLLRAKRSQPGSRYDVHALTLRQAPTAS